MRPNESCNIVTSVLGSEVSVWMGEVSSAAEVECWTMAGTCLSCCGRTVLMVVLREIGASVLVSNYR